MVFVVAALRLAPVPSYLVAVIVSQLLSPILWDHYALLLLLPVAWLRRPRALVGGRVRAGDAVVLAGQVPAWIYPAAFWACLATVVVVGRRPVHAEHPQPHRYAHRPVVKAP